jgi:uncharacterized protein
MYQRQTSRIPFFKRIRQTFVVFFMLVNIAAAFQAYNFTHFTSQDVLLPKLGEMSAAQKLKALVFGVALPKQVVNDAAFPQYQIYHLGADKGIATWYRANPAAKGTVLLAHGHGGNKGMMSERADEIYNLGYSVLLPDFYGSGNSVGYTTSIGYHEAEVITICYEFWRSLKIKEPFIGFGTSMGAASLMRANTELKIPFDQLILECPFGTLHQAVKNRFTIMKVPTLGMDYLLLFWGSIWKNFNAFQWAPEENARQITCPVLIIRGAKDNRVIPSEVENILNNCASKNKQLITLENSDHADFLQADLVKWREMVGVFLK